MKAFLRLMGKLRLAIRFKEIITNCIPSSEAPSSTSLLDGFGDSCDLGANSRGTRWALHGREPQRAASKSRSRWQSSERSVRREGGSRAARPSSYRRRLKLELTRNLLEINREFRWSLERLNPFLTPSGIPVDITKVGALYCELASA